MQVEASYPAAQIIFSQIAARQQVTEGFERVFADYQRALQNCTVYQVALRMMNLPILVPSRHSQALGFQSCRYETSNSTKRPGSSGKKTPLCMNLIMTYAVARPAGSRSVLYILPEPHPCRVDYARLCGG